MKQTLILTLNNGNYAKVNPVAPQPSSLWGETVGENYSTPIT
jgi:hypothetical protein